MRGKRRLKDSIKRGSFPFFFSETILPNMKSDMKFLTDYRARRKEQSKITNDSKGKMVGVKEKKKSWTDKCPVTVSNTNAIKDKRVCIYS